MTFVNPRERSVAHFNAGNKYNSLRNRARIFYEIEIENISIDKAIEKLNILSDTRNELNEKSPQVSRKSFENARRGIEEGEAEYKADKQDTSMSYKTINARAEGIESKPSYKKPLRFQRCLIPASGFYQWDKSTKPSIPYYFQLKNE